MLSGKLPFKADTAWEWATQHMTQAPVPIESLPEGSRTTEAMRAALRKALAKSPDDRFQTVREFIDAFSGSSVAPAVTAPLGAAAPGRQKTEVGTPLDVGAAFAQPPMGGMPGAPAVGYTPVGGNVAFPTPAGIPQPPPRDAGGGNRKPLLVAAGLIGVASIVAIVFAVRGSGGNKDVTFDPGNTQVAPATSLVAASTASGGSTPPVDTGSPGGDIPPLNGGTTPRPAPPHGNPNPGPGPGPAPPHPGPGPTPTPTPTTPPTPPPAKFDGPECQKARTLKALGHPKEAQTWALACIAKGGNPN
jgi:hypothetical protein